MKYDYDIIILGGGSAGLVSSKLASGLGKKVAIIEKDQPRYIVLYFLRDVDRGSIRSAIDQSFRRNAGERVSAMKIQIKQFLNSLPNMNQGQTLAFSYLPESGTTVFLMEKYGLKLKALNLHQLSHLCSLAFLPIAV